MRVRKIKPGKIARVAALFFLFVILMFPFYFMLITSLKSEKDILITPIDYFPNPIVLENYVHAWNDSKFALYFFNTAIISILTLLLVSVVSMMTGYALSRYKFVGKSLAMVIFLVTQIVPSALLLICLLYTSRYRPPLLLHYPAQCS